MLLSLSWLREFTPYEGTAEALGDRLTMFGLELEDIQRPYDAISAIAVGYVAECVQHPHSDHLHCCKVDVGQGELLDIVCGAPNVAAGQKVPVALVGTRLPDGTVIKKAKLRGAPSFGMICSERELGLTEDHSGIMVLPDSAAVGARIVDVLELDREVLDISITPNRADCLSVLGLARETALAFNLPLNVPELPLHLDADGPEAIVSIEIAEPELCWLYSGRVISEITVAPSPMRVRHRLHAVGVRPISNIVDVTNYILFECGQPLHSFDLDKLRGGHIVVRSAREGEKLVTLDGQERVLTSRDLCICDAERPVGLAGVMGGLNTEITDDSRNVLLESAVFRPGTIRKTSRRLGLSSEASYRFERGIDQQRTIWALDRACALMAAFGGGVVRRGLSIEEPRPFVPARIAFRPARADALLGARLSPEFDEKTLSGMGCAVEKDSDVWRVEQPSWRPDLTREADLIEEVGRVHGLNTIPPVLPPVQLDLARAAEPESRYAFWLRIKHWGAGLGLNEAVNYSFVGHKDLDHLGLPAEGRISIMNPLSTEQNALRTALAPGLLQDLRNNLAQGAQGLRLFELAHVFEADPDSETTVHETGMLGILLYGARHDTAWPHVEADMDYADLKGVVEHLLHFLHLPAPVCRQAEAHPFLLPCVDVLIKGRRVGCMGRVKPALAEDFHSRKAVWLAELNLEVLRELHDGVVVRFASLPVYPPVRRDITVTAGLELKVGHVLDHLVGLGLPLLEDAVLVDCFEPQSGPCAEAGRNLTFRLTFRHAGRTLKDAEVDKERKKVAESLVKNLGVRV
ncbi:phenylalanine--tRNA ligase subunit beta [uncultured Desulfovibrio sp.]|uniref:phenylalanine--tRNA ligase subunit beta n=1 Tax=uncultured Desulfovibrio sp. TaxID=167968 RepID=UPI00263467F3|nr:phenylalanine--tRNA ligase subunit beta [uncultured Desulfovibrio sp.]